MSCISSTLSHPYTASLMNYYLMRLAFLRLLASSFDLVRSYSRCGFGTRRKRERERGRKRVAEQEKEYERRLDERAKERSIVIIIVYHKESAVDFRTRHFSVPRLAIFSAIRSSAAGSSIYNHFCAALPDRWSL